MSIKDLILNKREYASVEIDSGGRAFVNRQEFFRDSAVKKTVESLKAKSSSVSAERSTHPPSDKK